MDWFKGWLETEIRYFPNVKLEDCPEFEELRAKYKQVLEDLKNDKITVKDAVRELYRLRIDIKTINCPNTMDDLEVLDLWNLLDHHIRILDKIKYEQAKKSEEE